MDWILQSGPIGITIVALVPVGILWAALGTTRPVRWWADVWVAFACALTNLAVLGTTMGLVVGFAAVANAPAASKAALLSEAMGLAARPLALAAVGIVIITAAAAVTHGLRRDATVAARPPGWGTRLMVAGGVLLTSLIPACGLALLFVLVVFEASTPSSISTLLFATAGGALLSVLAQILYVPFRVAAGRKAQATAGDASTA
jgi:hypothetical protein